MADPKYMRQQNRNRQMAQKMSQRGMGDGPGSAANGATGTGAQGLQDKFSRGILSSFSPGNIGDINNVIWPFAFMFQPQLIAPGQSLIQSFSVTQEAGFLWRSLSQATFRVAGGNYTYIDPFVVDEGLNSPNGLVFGLQDAQSTRQFNGRALEDISLLGNSNFPTVYPSTLFLLPNQTMQLTLSNNNATDTYYTCVTVWGYRVRVKDAQKILSTVTG